MVRLIMVLWPSSARTGIVFSFASLANTAICGVLTQFGTRYCSRLLSYATACGLPNFTDVLPRGALRMVRTGGAFPFAVSEKQVAVELPMLDTQTSLFFVSTEIPAGWFRVVLSPLMIRAGATLP